MTIIMNILLLFKLNILFFSFYICWAGACNWRLSVWFLSNASFWSLYWYWIPVKYGRCICLCWQFYGGLWTQEPYRRTQCFLWGIYLFLVLNLLVLILVLMNFSFSVWFFIVCHFHALLFSFLCLPSLLCSTYLMTFVLEFLCKSHSSQFTY